MRLAILISAALLISACGDSAPAEPEQPGRPQQSESAAGRQEAESAVLEGEVWFAGGAVELPEGAVAVVSLLDTSLQDVAATLIGEQTLAVAALPFGFRIEYDPSLIEDRNEYSLQARIELEDDLLYTNDTVHLVLTGGAPAQSDIEVIRITPPKAGEAFTPITVRVVPAEGAAIPLGSQVTARMVDPRRGSELIDEISIPILAFPVELNLLYDMSGLDSTDVYEIDVSIADGDRLLFGLPSPLRFDPSAPPAEPLPAELEPLGAD